ncbi:autotransporter outer membrane beta-barrel domain-containing protein [Campylobacter hyointestinalis]|uniref:autotransporter outer membrane beta-barrel domain-containing protein n=2 Tax=Campylobacter hyointestinalis TaxID=198 RepID=UPI000DCC5055|nr:autotransporter outer membrane beta-barrel domain-containing protein [Campylobacter hyointestinalis]RAZ25137.1 autotransporter outer membrane beta-barrel domain-containing protein [Campylobacter hyointestinalis subsp. lawsonii]RAZ39381.1 autotransporter outer membrane beta-barrel domain-containing protein [Campylobacter hyointestinalis subsp. lawsonii]
MNSKVSKIIILACTCSSLSASDFWASGVSINSGWSAYLQHPNQCWGAVAGNTLGWWQKNLTVNVGLKDDAPQGNKAITDWFYDKYPYIQGGLQPYRGMIYYLKEFAPNFKIYETHDNPTYLEKEYGPTKISGAPFWTERYNYQSEGITKSLIENFQTGKVVAALTDDTHTVTLWGIEVDEKTGKIKKGYVSDSVKDKAGQLTLREVIGNYAPDNKGNETFRFLYSYYVSSTNTYVTDLYEIYSITYLSIDEARNNGTYVDSSNRKDCLLSVLPGGEWACKISDNQENSNNQGENNSENSSSTENQENLNNQNNGNQGSSSTENSGNTENSSSQNGGNQSNTENSTNTQNQGNLNNQGSTSNENTNQDNTSSTTPENGNNNTGNQENTNQGNQGDLNNQNTSNQSSNNTQNQGNSNNQGGISSENATNLITQSVRNEINKHSELNLALEKIGDITLYKIQKNGKDIALYNPNLSTPLVENKGLINYTITKNDNGGIEITKSTNQAALKEANDASKLSMDINYADINNLNKRMGELRGINATAGSWARVFGGQGSSDGFENKFTHVQAGFDKQSQISSGSIFSGITVTHTSSDIDGDNAKGDVKTIGGGFYISGVFDNGWYMDAIAKYTRNNHKMDYNFPNMKLSFLDTDYNTNSLYLGGEFGYRFDFDKFYIEPQAEFVYLNTSGATLNNSNGFEMEIKSSDLLVGRAGFNFAREVWLGKIRAYALGGLSYQWEMVKNAEILIDGDSAKNNDKDSRMLMNLGLNMVASENLRIGLTLEKSAFGDYDTDLAINLNARYSF